MNSSPGYRKENVLELFEYLFGNQPISDVTKTKKASKKTPKNNQEIQEVNEFIKNYEIAEIWQEERFPSARVDKTGTEEFFRIMRCNCPDFFYRLQIFVKSEYEEL